MRSDRSGTTASERELFCWRLAMAQDAAIRKMVRVDRCLPGARWLRMLSRRAVLLVWWAVTFQLPRQAALWLRARRLRRTPPALVTALITHDVRPAALRLRTSDTPAVSVLISSFGKVGTTLRCLASIAAWPPQAPIEVIVIDDASGDIDIPLLELVRGVRVVINPTNLGYLRSCNVAARLARGDYLLLLNNDTQVTPGWLDSLLAVLRARPDAGAVGSMLLYPDGGLQEAGGIIWNDGSGMNYGRGDHPDRPVYKYLREVDYCSAASLMVRRTLWEELGGFDEAFTPAYYEDSDLAFRLRARGYKVLYQPRSRVVHLEGVSHGTDTGRGVKRHQLINQQVFMRRWAATLAADHSAPGERILRARERSAHRPLVMVVDHYVPEPDRDAGSRAVLGLIDTLLSTGAVVKFWPHNRMYSPGYTEALQDAGVEVFFGGHFDTFEEWVAENGAELDCVVLSRPDVARAYLGPLKRYCTARLVYYGHDLHGRRMRMQADNTGEAAAMREAERVERLERWIWRSVDAVLYFSAEEAAAVAALEPAARARVVIPFGFEAFGSPRLPPPGRDILFVGGFAHPPNIEAARWLARSILPLVRRLVPDCRLVMIGSRPTVEVRALAGEAVTVIADVTDAELRRRYFASRVVVAPLRSGAGVKLKVVEALRDGVPLVTTAVGAQGLPGLADVASVADDAADIADAIAALLRDDGLWVARCTAQIDYARFRFGQEAMRRSLLEAIGPIAHAGERHSAEGWLSYELT